MLISGQIGYPVRDSLHGIEKIVYLKKKRSGEMGARSREKGVSYRTDQAYHST